jgi:two-component system sensor histidine kinase MprB
VRSHGRRRVSLRSRVTWLAASCVAGAVALVSLGAYLTVRQNLYDQIDSSLERKAYNVVHSEAAVETPAGEPLFPAAFLSLTDVQFAVINDAGTVVFPDRTYAPPIGPGEIAVATGERQASLRTDGRTSSRVYAVPYDGNALVIAQSLQPTREQLGDLSLVLFLIGGAGVVVAAVAGTAVARTGLRPVQRLTRATERVANIGDLRPIQVDGDDELARLSHSFNQMLAAVAYAQDRQRQLVADAGHELRTPLTSLRTNLELLLAAEAPNAPLLSEKDKTEIHADLRAQLAELTQLIGDLVELAREDAPHIDLQQVDMVEVVEQALARAKRRAADVTFEVDLQPWYLLGEPVALERAVLNLLDNAVKFSPSGGTVRVDLRPVEDGYAFLQVADAGPGINDADLPYVFDRFYRSDEARTLPGSGLGLAIVKSAAERHGGAVYAGRSADGGALMAIKLPGRTSSS